MDRQNGLEVETEINDETFDSMIERCREISEGYVRLRETYQAYRTEFGNAFRNRDSGLKKYYGHLLEALRGQKEKITDAFIISVKNTKQIAPETNVEDFDRRIRMIAKPFTEDW